MEKNTREKFQQLCEITHSTEKMWNNARGFAPDSVADKLDVAMLHWLTELTDALKIWIDIGLDMTDGELILARTNLGAIVEFWLRFFYCVYYEDYIKDPILDHQGKMREPNKETFEELKKFSNGRLWHDNATRDYKFVDEIQHRRNSIHAFEFKNIGIPKDFLKDIELKG